MNNPPQSHSLQSPSLAVTAEPLTIIPEHTPEPVNVALSFTQLGILPEITAALAEDGITHPFAIQELTLPLALAGNDIIGQAKTGTGKTLGFSIPLIQNIAGLTIPAPNSPLALVMVPTRELCMQVYEVISQLITHISISFAHDQSVSTIPLTAAALYGGMPYNQQKKSLSKAGIVVGTPGRLRDFINEKYIDLSHIAVCVLDEADEMLDLGFLPAVEAIIRALPQEKQTMLFSATLSDPVVTLARSIQRQATLINAHADSPSNTHKTTQQFCYRAHDLDKPEMVARMLQASNRDSTIVFTRTKRRAATVANLLQERGFNVGALHGDLNQQLREKFLSQFRDGTINILVATDVAARGIDIDSISHVINYECPDDENTYVHRIGRTGRAGKTGTAITLVDWEDLTRWRYISSKLQLNLDEPVETYSSSAHLYSDLGIPVDSTGKTANATENAGSLPPARSPRRSSREEGRPGTRNTNRQRGPRRGKSGPKRQQTENKPTIIASTRTEPNQASGEKKQRRRTVSSRQNSGRQENNHSAD